jgi:hypothetical protein
MNGVEILSATEVVTEYAHNEVLGALVYLGIVLLMGILGFVMSDRGEKLLGILLGCVLGVLVGLFGWGASNAATQTPVAYETHYKVTIDDSVSMNEFLDKYEILDQEGKIYTVKERE